MAFVHGMKDDLRKLSAWQHVSAIVNKTTVSGPMQTKSGIKVCKLVVS